MKAVHLLYGLGILAGAAIAAEACYKHPTYGNGLRALVAAAQAAELFG